MVNMSIKKKESKMASSLPSDKIILTGFMGCGKSYFSQRLAEALKLPLYDTDSLIEAKEGISITEIFSRYDESYFRTLEAEIAFDIQKSSQAAVYATGGGFPIFYHDILEIGTVIYMDIPFKQIVARMSAEDIKKRPLFQDLDQALALYNSRLELYKKRCHLQIDATQSIEQMVQCVQSFLHTR